MPISFACACGKAFRVADEFAGRRTKCSACAASLTVPAATTSAEDDAFRLLESAEVPDRPARASRREWDAPPKAVVPPPPPPAAKTVPPPDKKARPVRRPREDSGGGFRITLSPAVAGGFGSMALATVWIVIAMSSNRIPIYAPILFVIGLVAVVRGIFGAPEE